ncbi:transglutaminase TgpA family protein [Marinobacterium jannaschii]|uniref:transglutaminase TgpA family protein n=1 Tax=Marinobacterium jannaschii TaxID=64970 RepID=UPI0006850266|nr:DUF3488 and transglutaminase-like domain-containing protein [Marinobacterium jannaschii]
MKPEFQLSRPALIWQMVAVLLVVLPLVWELPVWLLLVTLMTTGWRYMVYLGRWSFPHWSIRTILVAGLGLPLMLKIGQGISLDSMVSLLVLGFSLKMLEIYKRRDALLVMMVAYLVAASTLLFDQSMTATFYVLFCILIITTALGAVFQSSDSGLSGPFRHSAMILLQALPLMVVLFLLMPRLPPLWTVPLSSTSTKTGLSEKMSPGDISRLTRNADIAFRAEFVDRKPEQSELYWRVMTYGSYDKGTWSEPDGAHPLLPRHVSVTDIDLARSLGDELAYSVVMEPSFQQYLPALDIPLAFSAEIRQSTDFTLRASEPLRERYRYQLRSATQYRTYPRSAESLLRYLRLPPGNPKSRALAQQLVAENADAESYIAALLTRFNNSFIYSLTPPLLGQNDIDDFLFESQTGFCGHYSGALVFMLRAANIPARVVAGYQGGEWSPDGSYMLVRQYDAHAWVEAWLPERGWVRYDPTAAVAPERVQMPAQDMYQDQPDFLADLPLAGLHQADWLAQLRWQLDAIDFRWQRWVLNYQNRQQGLLERLLGKVDSIRLVFALMIPFALMLLVIYWQQRRQENPVVRPVWQRQLDKLLSSLIPLGWSRHEGETLRQFCERVAEGQPQWRNELVMLADCHERLQYSCEQDLRLESAMIEQLKRCRDQLGRR